MEKPGPSFVNRVRGADKQPAAQQLNLAEELLKHSVFHRESIYLYSDKSISFGVLHHKPLLDVLPISVLHSGDTALREALLEHGWSAQQAAKDIRGVKDLIRRARPERPTHYNASERNMMRAAAEIAARQPEATALFRRQDEILTTRQIEALPMAEPMPADEAAAGMAVTSGPPQLARDQRMRFIVVPENTLSALDPDMGFTHGVMMTLSGSVVSSHPMDKREWGATTVHEIVHAFDLAHGITQQHMARDMPMAVDMRVGMLEDIQQALAKRQKLDYLQESTFRGWQDAVRALPEEDQAWLNPERLPQNHPLFAQSAFVKFVDRMKIMAHLPPKIYDTPEKRMLEYPAVFEELARINNNDPLNPDGASRKLARYLLPDVSEFMDTHYLPLLQKEYDRSLQDKQVEPRNRKQLRFSMVRRSDIPQGPQSGHVPELRLMRNKLMHAMIEIDNFHLQADSLEKKDAVLGEMREYFMAHARPRNGMSKDMAADLEVSREMIMTQKAIDAARQQLDGPVRPGK